MSAETELNKNQLNYRRSKGVSKAWARERDLVRQGRGTREWSTKQQKELLKTGRVKGYQGHYMKSVSKHPDQADNPKNIQFLCARKGNNEHLKAHRGDYRNESNGRYNPRTDTIRPLKGDKVRAMNSHELKNKAIEQRGYTKYAMNGSGQAKSGKAAKDASSKMATSYNGKTYSRTRGKSGGASKAQSSKSAQSSRSTPARYGQKASSAKQTSSKGSYGHTAARSSSARSHGSYGHTSGASRGSSAASHGRSSSSGARSSSSGSRGSSSGGSRGSSSGSSHGSGSGRSR